MRPIGGIQLQSPILFPQGHEMAIGRYDKLAVSAHGHVLPVGSTDGFPPGGCHRTRNHNALSRVYAICLQP